MLDLSKNIAAVKAVQSRNLSSKEISARKSLHRQNDIERESVDNSWVHQELLKRKSYENIIKIFVIFNCITDKRLRWEALSKFPSADVKFVQSKYHEDKDWNPIMDNHYRH